MKYWLGNNGVMSGRADGSVFMRNHVVRGMAMPSNPQTVAQSVQRGNFGSLSGQWNSLTEDQRAAWNAFRISTFDNLGHSVNIEGKTAFVLLNRNLFNAAQAQILVPPIPASPLALSNLQLTADESTPLVEITFDPDPIPAGTTWLVFATKTFSPGTYKPGGSQFKLIKAIAGASTSPQDVTGAYQAVYGNPVANGALFVRVVPVKNSTGFTAPGLSARVIVTP